MQLTAMNSMLYELVLSLKESETSPPGSPAQSHSGYNALPVRQPPPFVVVPGKKVYVMIKGRCPGIYTSL